MIRFGGRASYVGCGPDRREVPVSSSNLFVVFGECEFSPFSLVVCRSPYSIDVSLTFFASSTRCVGVAVHPLLLLVLLPPCASAPRYFSSANTHIR